MNRLQEVGGDFLDLAKQCGLDLNLLIDVTDDPVYGSKDKIVCFYYQGGNDDGKVTALRNLIREELGLELASKIGVATW